MGSKIVRKNSESLCIIKCTNYVFRVRYEEVSVNKSGQTVFAVRYSQTVGLLQNYVQEQYQHTQYIKWYIKTKRNWVKNVDKVDTEIKEEVNVQANASKNGTETSANDKQSHKL